MVPPLPLARGGEGVAVCVVGGGSVGGGGGEGRVSGKGGALWRAAGGGWGEKGFAEEGRRRVGGATGVMMRARE